MTNSLMDFPACFYFIGKEPPSSQEIFSSSKLSFGKAAGGGISHWKKPSMQWHYTCSSPAAPLAKMQSVLLLQI